MKIERVLFSASVKFFESKFIDRWKLKEYKKEEPALFVGCYSTKDIEAILAHKAPKIVMLLGSDMPSVNSLMKDRSITFVSDKKHNLNIFKKVGVRYIDAVIPLKDFSAFSPITKGDKIYCYINDNTPKNWHKYTKGMLSEPIKYYGKDKFIFGIHGYNEHGVIENYYKKSFINVQINPFAGFTSALEMAFMGRKSISLSEAPFSIPFNSADHIIQIIKEEMDAPSWDNLVDNYLHMTSDWLEI